MRHKYLKKAKIQFYENKIRYIRINKPKKSCLNTHY